MIAGLVANPLMFCKGMEYPAKIGQCKLGKKHAKLIEEFKQEFLASKTFFAGRKRMP